MVTISNSAISATTVTAMSASNIPLYLVNEFPSSTAITSDSKLCRVRDINGDTYYYTLTTSGGITEFTFDQRNTFVDGTNGITISPSNTYLAGTGNSVTIRIAADQEFLRLSSLAIAESKRIWKKTQIKNNLLIKVKQRQYYPNVTPQEERARNTLRDMLTEREWRRYVTNGFIMVKGSSYWYQIFARGGVFVYWQNKQVNFICIHTSQNCPPTDHVINMKMLIEFDEEAIWQLGNVSTRVVA